MVNILKFNHDLFEKQQDLVLFNSNISNETSSCMETINTFYNLYKIDLQVVLNIGFSIGIRQKTIEQFFRSCNFKYIEFQYSLDKSDYIFKRQENLDDIGNELSNFNYTFVDLKPMRIYYLSYCLVKMINQTKFNYSFFAGDRRIVIKTCFGQPGPPFKLRHGRVDEDYLIYWETPFIVNAPNVCYYEIVLIKKKGTMNVMNTTKLYIKLKKSDLAKIKRIEIYAVNSIKCYGSKSNCNFELLKSDKEIIDLDQSSISIINQHDFSISKPIVDEIDINYHSKAYSIYLFNFNLYLFTILTSHKIFML